jgi:hypothetical protein
MQGCDHAAVDEMVDEIKTGMRTRGDTSQIICAEETIQRRTDVERSLI